MHAHRREPLPTSGALPPEGADRTSRAPPTTPPARPPIPSLRPPPAPPFLPPRLPNGDTIGMAADFYPFVNSRGVMVGAGGRGRGGTREPAAHARVAPRFGWHAQRRYTLPVTASPTHAPTHPRTHPPTSPPTHTAPPRDHAVSPAGRHGGRAPPHCICALPAPHLPHLDPPGECEGEGEARIHPSVCTCVRFFVCVPEPPPPHTHTHTAHTLPAPTHPPTHHTPGGGVRAVRCGRTEPRILQH